MLYSGEGSCERFFSVRFRFIAQIFYSLIKFLDYMKKIFSLSGIVILSAFIASVLALAVCATFYGFMFFAIVGGLALCLSFGVFD